MPGMGTTTSPASASCATQETRCLAFQLAGNSLPPGNKAEGSSPIVLLHSCPGLGASYEERVEDVFFQPHEALAVPAMPQRWVGYLQNYSSTNTMTQHNTCPLSQLSSLLTHPISLCAQLPQSSLTLWGCQDS